MAAGFLADLVLIAHLASIVFAMFGALCALRWAWAPLAHLPALAWAALIELTSGVCPLTPLENTLRRAAGESGYSGSFVEHYLIPLIYPRDLTADDQFWLAIGLLLLNLVLYAYVLARRGGRRAGGRPTRRSS